MRFSNRAVLAGALLAFVLGGCATAYQPEGSTGGYKDVKLADDTYRVSFFGNGYTSRPVVLKYFLYRCAELTLQHGYTYFEVFSAKHVALRGPVGEPRFMRASYTVPTYTYVPAGTVTRYSATGVIRMYGKDMMIVDPSLFDARDVVATLGPEVRSGHPGPRIPAKYRRIEGKFPLMPVDRRPTASPSPPPETGPVRLEDLKDLMHQ